MCDNPTPAPNSEPPRNGIDPAALAKALRTALSGMVIVIDGRRAGGIRG